ncbi:hypothetical protein [Rubripirellula reticaptiva]|uniref:hypothetical protein n=1 Tax=Rubripirellula reticaptiva TaxID=2528013 RepID=UPI001FEB5984|nr:hypothetical protein [Rubripirellula reticaptiva]
MLRISDFQFFDPDAEFQVTFGDLPHWQQPGATDFITDRLSDSNPLAACNRIMAQRYH